MRGVNHDFFFSIGSAMCRLHHDKFNGLEQHHGSHGSNLNTNDHTETTSH
jgi:hypothetical protein